MKNLRGLLVVAAAVLFASAAQAQEFGVKADIPFAFVVSNHVYPAGEYTVLTINPDSDNLWLRGSGEMKQTVALTPIRCYSRKTVESSKLVFHRVGDTYFLSQIWVQGNASGREFPESKREIELAATQGKAERVIVAVNLIH
jgi:hypothetical protein